MVHMICLEKDNGIGLKTFLKIQKKHIHLFVCLIKYYLMIDIFLKNGIQKVEKYFLI